ncbi:toxin [Bacillus sp. FJAT-47783]|uniref:anthrax toxin lethal factor-related metalloendopeptidase n=1 Tax=Bacillus sp. FJAT-47783 TaxID=2922712 RepID=UPI001FACBDEC|nr:toxin [Bacillus sp. FJAT-47783]
MMILIDKEYDKIEETGHHWGDIMKKLGLFFMNLGALFLIFVNVNTSPVGLALNEYHFTKHSPFLTAPINQLVYLPYGDFNEDEALKMIEHISHIHPSVLERATQKNLKIKLFTGKLTEQSELLLLRGKLPRGYSKADPRWDFVPGIGGGEIVFAKIGHSEFGSGHGSVALELHEFAHSLDKYVFQSVRYDPVFKSVWKVEAKSLFPNETYFHRFPEEYFAECFALYYLNEETKARLRNNAPLTYEFFENMLKEQNR